MFRFLLQAWQLCSMVEKHFVTQKTARVYYNEELPSKECKYVWICLHGYGQLGQYFSRNFSVLDSEEHWVVAPEGLSKMYLEGVYGRVGASWMTKEDRLTEIDDYMYYLDRVMENVQAKLAHCAKPPKCIVLGFSQGAATACRWVLDGNVTPDHLVLWSGIFPPDLKLQPPFSKSLKVWQLIGDEDEYMNDNRWAENTQIMDSTGLKAQQVPFAGAHKIYPDVLKEFSAQLVANDRA